MENLRQDYETLRKKKDIGDVDSIEFQMKNLPDFDFDVVTKNSSVTSETKNLMKKWKRKINKFNI